MHDEFVGMACGRLPNDSINCFRGRSNDRALVFNRVRYLIHIVCFANRIFTTLNGLGTIWSYSGVIFNPLYHRCPWVQNVTFFHFFSLPLSFTFSGTTCFLMRQLNIVLFRSLSHMKWKKWEEHTTRINLNLSNMIIYVHRKNTC